MTLAELLLKAVIFWLCVCDYGVTRQCVVVTFPLDLSTWKLSAAMTTAVAKQPTTVDIPARTCVYSHFILFQTHFMQRFTLQTWMISQIAQLENEKALLGQPELGMTTNDQAVQQLVTCSKATGSIHVVLAIRFARPTLQQCNTQ